MCTDPDDVNGWTTCTTNPDTESELIEIDCEVCILGLRISSSANPFPHATHHPAKSTGTLTLVISAYQCKDDPMKWPGDCPKDCPYFQRYCRVKPVDDPDFALSIPFSLPAQRWLTPYITAWIVSKKLDGSIDRLVDLNVKQVYCPGELHETCAAWFLAVGPAGTYIATALSSLRQENALWGMRECDGGRRRRRRRY